MAVPADGAGAGGGGGEGAGLNVPLVGEGEDAVVPGIHTEELLMAMVVGLVTWVAVGCMVFGGVVPYIPQYRSIRRSRDADGFSTFVCLILLIANVLRILFWFGKRYELPLLIQSVIMIITMLAMMHICVSVKADKVTVSRRITDLQIEYFWRWTRFRDYCVFLTIFWCVGCTLTFLLMRVRVYVELLGLTALLLEACLGVPQLWQNYSNRSTEGMSVQMVVMWLSGDIFKTAYFLLRNSPAQFWVCGSMQVMVDILILLQVFSYWKRTATPKQPRLH